MRIVARNLREVGAVLVLGFSLLLGACAPLETPTGQPGAAGPGTQVSGYPGAGYPGPNATALSIPTNPAVITPPASETVQTGPITEVANPQDSLPYQWRMENVALPAGSTSRLFLESQGQEVQLGNDSGGAQFLSASPQYLAWSFGDVGFPLTFKPGLYVRVIATGKDVLVDSREHVGNAKVDGDWMAYASWESVTDATGVPQYDAPLGTVGLLAYNLVTGQSITVSTEIPTVQGRGLASFFGLSHGRAGWIEYDLQKQTYAMKLEDLGSGAIQTIDVPLDKPLFFSLSANLIVWRDTYWHGYSLDRDAVFTIPYAPKELETKPIIVVARDSAVEWDVSVSNTAHQFYTAPVINK